VSSPADEPRKVQSAGEPADCTIRFHVCATEEELGELERRLRATGINDWSSRRIDTIDGGRDGDMYSVQTDNPDTANVILRVVDALGDQTRPRVRQLESTGMIKPDIYAPDRRQPPYYASWGIRKALLNFVKDVLVGMGWTILIILGLAFSVLFMAGIVALAERLSPLGNGILLTGFIIVAGGVLRASLSGSLGILVERINQRVRRKQRA